MVPSSLYDLSSINILVFEINQLSLFKKKKINQLSGALPANIGFTLPNLKLFKIGDNKFFGPIPMQRI